MHTRASDSELVKPLLEPERTLNRRLCRRNRRVPFEQRNESPAQPKVVYALILDINYFCHFLDILENYNPMDNEPMCAADRVVAPTPGFAITISETVNEFTIKGNHLTLVKGNQFDGRFKTSLHKHIHKFLGICDKFKYIDIENEVVRLGMFPLPLTGEAKTWLDELNEETIKTIAKNMLVEVDKFTFLVDFFILKMEEDSKVPLIFGRPFLHTVDVVIQVKHKELNHRVGAKRMTFHMDSAIKHSYSNDDTCFSIDVTDKTLEEDFDAFLNKGSKILYFIEGTILEEKLFAIFDEFMAMTADENSESDLTPENRYSKKLPLTPIIRSRHLLKNLLHISNSNVFLIT
nr:reverse transcriptase domain-containing protein [Tanacetum cinerariifolium]